MDYKHHFQITWNLMLQNIVALILTTLCLFGVSIFSVGILAPVAMAGYTQAILQMIREGREPKAQDLFSHMNLLFPLLGFGILVGIAIFIGFFSFFLPGALIAFAITFLFTYFLPLMTDQKLSLTKALTKSYEMAVKDNPTEHLIVVILYLCILTIGGSTFIGSLLTLPFATIFLLTVFDDKIRNNPVAPIR